MGFFDKIERHAAMASGNFNAIFNGVDIPPLPIAIQRLITEINKENPDIHGAFQLRPSTGPITSHWSQS
jgi:hypothetical protein